MASKSLHQAWLIVSNGIMMMGWMRVLPLMWLRINVSDETELCDQAATHLEQALRVALSVSFLELFNALVGVTRSKPAQVLLFAVIRLGVEVLVAPLLMAESSPCARSWPHVITVVCWSLGDSIRFACFFVDNLRADGVVAAKWVRYTVGPLLFPLGFGGEMLMVVTAAQAMSRPLYQYAMYGAACLWPAGFYPLYSQLLSQRRKFMQSLKAKVS